METQPNLRIVLTTEFGHKTDISIDLADESMDSVFWAIRDALAGCGYAKETIDEWFPNEL